ncbi:MAG: hypothetical protein IJR71_05060 [Prevotella sp.]|nr:hypothetical protein [Prevotella sp.]
MTSHLAKRRILPRLGSVHASPALLTMLHHFFFLFHYDNAFNPIIDPMSVVRKNSLQKVAGSRNMRLQDYLGDSF